jgi:hypothetical protein
VVPLELDGLYWECLLFGHVNKNQNTEKKTMSKTKPVSKHNLYNKNHLVERFLKCKFICEEGSEKFGITKDNRANLSESAGLLGALC